MADITLTAEIEGAGAEALLHLGAPATLVVEGRMQGAAVLEAMVLRVHVVAEADATTIAQFGLPLSDMLLGLGDFLTQIDFVASQVGVMLFHLNLDQAGQTVATAHTQVRVINPLRDGGGKRRKTGAGVLKVYK